MSHGIASSADNRKSDMTMPRPSGDRRLKPVALLLLEILWEPVLVILICGAFLYILIFAPQTYSGTALLGWTMALTLAIVAFYVLWRLVAVTRGQRGD
jgi:hypothetical protein